jgi:hypothetical protein
MQPVPSINVNSYETLQPLMAALKSQTDKLPKNSLPTETQGTIQENAHSFPQVTLYNSHGILDKNNPNTLIGYA